MYSSMYFLSLTNMSVVILPFSFHPADGSEILEPDYFRQACLKMYQYGTPLFNIFFFFVIGLILSQIVRGKQCMWNLGEATLCSLDKTWILGWALSALTYGLHRAEVMLVAYIQTLCVFMDVCAFGWVVASWSFLLMLEFNILGEKY